MAEPIVITKFVHTPGSGNDFDWIEGVFTRDGPLWTFKAALAYGPHRGPTFQNSNVSELYIEHSGIQQWAGIPV